MHAAEGWSFWSWYRPLVHGAHALLASTKEVPALQNLHPCASLTAWSWNLPPAQAVHPVLVLVGAYWPGPQPRQAAPAAAFSAW